MEEIHILHTNDLHSHLENWPKIRRFLNGRKQKLIAADKSVITVDLGDFVDRVHPLTEATDGKANVSLMDQVEYDAVTIGNNEGVGNSHFQLEHLYDQADFSVILGNLRDKKTQKAPLWALPYKIIETKQGTRIALLALTAPFPLTYEPNGWDISEVDEVLPQLLSSVRSQADILVLMSHLGIQEERRIAEKYPEIEVVLGSHTHHLFVNGECHQKVLLAAAGKFGRFIGEVTLRIKDHHLVFSQANVTATDPLPEIPQDVVEINGYERKGHELLQQQKVAKLPFALKKNVFSEHSLMKAALNAVKERAHTEAAILNNGLFLKDLPSGIVNNDDLHEILPHPMHLLKVTLKGGDLIRLLGEMEKNRSFLLKFPMVGMGFRGKIFGELCYDGVSYDKEKKQAVWMGEPVTKNGEYTFVTVDHFMFIPFFPTIELAGKNELLFPEFIRTVLGEYLAVHYPIL